MKSVGSILNTYDEDSKFPLYGFGATLPKAKKPSNCFAMNGDSFKPEVFEVENAIRVFKHASKKIKPGAHPCMGSVLKKVNTYCIFFIFPV